MKKVVDDERLMVKICDMYYNQDMNQKTISTQLGLSRPTISRIINNAKDQGVVKITIKNLENTNYVDLERTIETIYNLQEVIVVDHKSNPDILKEDLGRVASRYLERIIKDDNVVGISMGTTLYQVVNHMENATAKNVLFVPMIGGMGHLRMELHSNYLVEAMAQLYNGEFIPMHAPARVSNRAIRSEFVNEKSIAKVIKMCNNLDVALVGIGYPNQTSAIMATGYYDNDEMQKLKAKNVAGDICMQFYDASGNTTPYRSDNNVIGIEIKKLRKVPHSIGVAGGVDKVSAIRGAINGRYINTLITDVECAKKLAENN
ncbi:MAG: sugar-binding transcriptional regulator [Eubacteriaceae bacterium]|nr:sugar-binding transcriptional regulator [Eubacteriaceae bacterium]MDD4508286.1 sugar-binding transcriptional regulator [Eubacteriaceae bacterium]